MPTRAEWIECKDLPVDVCNAYRVRYGHARIGAEDIAHEKQRACEKRMPSLAKRGANYSKAMLRWIRAGRPVCTEDQIAERLAICQACPLFDAVKEHCTKCGCPANRNANAMRNKLAMATESCPHPDGPRWTALVETAE